MPALRSRWLAVPVAAALVVLGAAAIIRAARPGLVRSTAPTIVLILTDDQRWDTLWAMPNVQRDLVRHGVTFRNAFVTDPLCCPSRASILTGQYAHTHGVWQNIGRYGGFQAFHSDHSTIATWLRAAGYRTALFGKYLNRYRGTYIPPGWYHWDAFAGWVSPYDFYYRYTLNVDGRLEKHGTDPNDYSTDVLARDTVDFIRQTAGPLFVYFAPYAPHTPVTPSPRDRDAFRTLPPFHPPSFNEADVSDKPAWVRALPPLGPNEQRKVDRLRLGTYRSLLAVDRAVGEIVDALRETGRLHNSLIVFSSDNGFNWGEHRWVNKAVPYEESIRVPLVIRYDRLRGTPRTDDHLVLNIDLAPTFADFASVPAPGVEGRSLLPLLEGTATSWRKDFLIEHMALLHVPSFCGVHTERYVYVHYRTGEEELYDLRADPYELDNRARDPSLGPVLRHLRARERVLCTPPPPVPLGGEPTSGGE